MKINYILGEILIFFIKIYQKVISPDLGLLSFWLKGKICIHTPHCSKYGVEVLKKYGFIPGIFMIMERISSCHPWNQNNYDPSSFKIVFFSSALIGVKFMEYLHKDKRFEVVGVVTTPEKQAGRGLNIQKNIIETTALNLGISNIIKPEKINPEKSDEGKEFYNWLKRISPDFIVVIAYGKIIPKSILDLSLIGPINLHGSILPLYRGASPIQSVLLNDEKETGLTVMYMNEKMDEGDIIRTYKFNIGYNWTSRNIIEKFEEIGPKFIGDCIWDFGKKSIGKQPQQHNLATYCKKIEKDNGKICIFKENLYSIYNKYRAYYNWPGIRFLHNKRFLIESIEIDKQIYINECNNPLIDSNKNLNPAINKILFKPEGKKIINFQEFKNGYLK